MEFGHVTESLGKIDFSLPPDTETTKKTLKASKNEGALSVHIGASKWGDKNWKGIIYPKKSLDNQLLHLYSKIFNTVEFSSTYYTIPKDEDINKWVAQVKDSPDFKFCPKFPQNITHIRRLANAEEPTEKFYQCIAGLGTQVGPLLLQLGENFSPKSFPNLKAYLQNLDPTYKVSVEVRHKEWYSGINYRHDLLNLLSDLNIGTVISDTSGRRDCVHMDLTTTDAYIRFVGNDLAVSDYKRLDEWVDRIKSWSEQGLRSVWFFMHQNNEKYVPQACVYFINQLNAKLGTSIKPPQLILDSGTNSLELGI